MSDFSVINNSLEAMKEFGFQYGYETFKITRNDIQALLDGKILAGDYDGEYSIFVRLED